MRADRDRRLSAVFLDRDGVINHKAPEGRYVTSWDAFRFLPGALDGLRTLGTLGVPVVVVTNQRGIARGHMSEEGLADIHARMRAAVTDAGGRVDAVYHCPHEGGCHCRKPAPGMLEVAAREIGIDLSSAVMVGDRGSDIAAGAAVGAATLLVGDAPDPSPPADLRAADLRAAAHRLVDQSFRASAISE